MAIITDKQTIRATLQSIRARLDLTQGELAERFGVAFATVNRWEGGVTMPQKAARTAITALAAEAGIDTTETAVDETESAARVTRRRSRRRQASVPSTKPMEQMLWDAACSVGSWWVSPDVAGLELDYKARTNLYENIIEKLPMTGLFGVKV